MSFLTGFCSDGEQYNDTSGLCEACTRGFYKNNYIDGILSSCQPCPPNFLTNSTGATIVDDCNIGKLPITVKGDETF